MDEFLGWIHVNMSNYIISLPTMQCQWPSIIHIMISTNGTSLLGLGIVVRSTSTGAWSELFQPCSDSVQKFHLYKNDHAACMHCKMWGDQAKWNWTQAHHICSFLISTWCYFPYKELSFAENPSKIGHVIAKLWPIQLKGCWGIPSDNNYLNWAPLL